MSNFIDFVSVAAQAGNGGKGFVSFRREKFVPKGTPNGGDGGRGGNVYIQADTNLHTLLDFTYNREFKAEDGGDGGKNNMTGGKGSSITIKVPLGTVIKDEKGNIIFDICHADQRELLYKGGIGGRGNAHFKSSTNQAPRYAQPGKPGNGGKIQLELKVLADVGLVGFPNAGKSTLLSVISNARPKIANYPFTTLAPNLGLVKNTYHKSFVVADIPGLIEGASKGKGLGFQFLKHVERTNILLFLIAADSEHPEEDFDILQHELEDFSDILAEKKVIKVLSKADILSEDLKINPDFFDFHISSVTRQGINELLTYLAKQIETNL